MFAMVTSEEVRSFIKRIPNKLDEYSYDRIVVMCNHFFPRLPISIVDFTNEPFFFHQQQFGGKNVIYRGRHITNPQNQPHKFVSEISFIPESEISKIKTFGRVNKPVESMFYGALKFATACIEAISKGNVFKDNNSAMVTVGTWMFDTPLKLAQMPHSEKYCDLFFNTVSYKSERVTLEKVRARNAEIRSQFGDELDFEILELFGDAFARFDIKNDFEYMLSNYYADRVFNRIPGFSPGEEIDGIMYPSVPNSYEEINIVLKPEVVREKMHFMNAMQVWVINDLANGGGGQFVPIRQRVRADENGELRWAGL